MSTILVLLGLCLLAAGAAAAVLRRDKKRGRPGCGGNCGCCASCGACRSSRAGAPTKQAAGPSARAE